MDHCQQIPSRNFSNDRLCEFLTQERKIKWEVMDQATSYYDLTDSDHPKEIQLPKDGEVSPAELALAAVTLLEKEWQEVLVKDRFLQARAEQPIAEKLYKMKFLPSWFPPPLSVLKDEEKNRLRHFIEAAASSSRMGLKDHAGLRYDPDGVADNFLQGIREGSALSCIGLMNPFRFARRILLQQDFTGVSLYQDTLLGEQHFHYGAQEANQLYDYSLDQIVGDGLYHWHPITALEQWALNIMNAGLKKLQRNEITLSAYIDRYLQRAYELAPHNYYVGYNLGIALYHLGEANQDPALMAQGLAALREVKKIYPSFQKLEPWKEKF